MKKIRVIYQSIVFTLVAVSVIMFSGLAQAATATVDGFVGVPWGASKDQVAAAMAQRGFKQVDELTLYGSRYLVYRGTFADEPAELVFVVGTNGFNRGSADLLNYRSELWHHCYEKIERLIAVNMGRRI